MNPADWKTIEEILGAALELPASQQAAYVAHRCGQTPEIRKEVEELLNAYHAAERSFEPLAGKLGLPDNWDDTFLGTRIGVYKLVAHIGDGGMGSVYRGERDDGEFQQIVAIKLVRAGLHDHELLRRLRGERQILALLEHPHIARLLDGGITPNAQPYIVMEYIEGARIIDYCQSHHLNIAQRLSLFRQICSAVHYAHQRLVVHRDIKPSNILVANDGTPKLLDFGIAKILDSSAAGLEGKTLTGLNPMTPDYASPEQIQGKALTTATDIYSLGVLLYELLTYQKPYKAAGTTAQEIARAVCDSNPPKPSTAASRRAQAAGEQATYEPVSSDLDHIVLKAMRKEPSERYASAEELSADIGNYLTGLPVRAREGSLRYLTAKFVARHKPVVALSAALLVALVVGLVLVSWEAHVARGERARAQRRFNDVRKLASSFMFEFHDSIKDLPGATPARKLVVTRALEYLDSLSQESASDTSLQRELAAAYEKVGDVQGDPHTANLGDSAGALASYGKALAIREALLKADPGNAALRSELSGTHWKIGLLLDARRDLPGALTHLKEALELTKQSSTSSDARSRDRLAGDHWSIAQILSDTGDWKGALDEYRQAASIHEAAIQAADSQVTDPQANSSKLKASIRMHLAGDYYGIAEVLSSNGEKGPALEAARKSAAILQEQSAADPLNTTLRKYLAGSYEQAGELLESQGLLSESSESFRKALEIYQAAMVADPSDAFSHRGVGYTQMKIADVLIEQKQPLEALKLLRKALDTFQSLAKAAPNSIYVAHNYGNVYQSMGNAYAALEAGSHLSAAQRREHGREACLWYQKSLDIRHDLERRGQLTAGDTEELNQEEKQASGCNKPSARSAGQSTPRQ